MVLMKPPVLRVELPERLYSGGEKLSGSVLLEAEQPLSVAGLRVTASGRARVEHRGGAGGGRRRREEEEYLRKEEALRLEEQLTTDSDGCFLLQPQKLYRFSFGFELPAAGLVSSYKGKFGSVRYCVRAELDRPSQNALRCEREFEVEEPLDVNQPDLMAPATGSTHKRVTCLFIPDGQVSISARIQRRGFCEGEDISISAQFENTTSRMVVPKAAIIAKHTYSAEGRSKESCEKLCCVRGNHIISGMCDVWQGKTLRVPKLRPSLLGCDIITVDYSLVIYLHIPGSEKLTLDLPLVIGTLSGVGSRTSSVSSWASLPLPPPPSWASLPHAPPSYSNVSRDLDGPRTPLLQDYDGEEDEGGLVMRAPEVCLPLPTARRSRSPEDFLFTEKVQTGDNSLISIPLLDLSLPLLRDLTRKSIKTRHFEGPPNS